MRPPVTTQVLVGGIHCAGKLLFAEGTERDFKGLEIRTMRPPVTSPRWQDTLCGSTINHRGHGGRRGHRDFLEGLNYMSLKQFV